MRFLLLSLMLGLSGCAPALGRIMVTAPNQLNPFASDTSLPPSARQVLGVDQQFHVNVGPPDASLCVSVIEPTQRKTPCGTVLVLHGIWNSSVWMLPTARMLADAGFRSVLVDLRGHGQSSGDWLTYGIQESKDISQVINELERRRLVQGPLGVYGISYGATTSIHLAGIDDRIQAVVAVAPFSAMRDVVPDYSRTVLPGVERLISDNHLQEAVDASGENASFDPDQSSALKAIQQTDAPVLIIHGTDDWLVPPYHALRLHEAAPKRSKLVFIPKTGHIKIWFDPSGEVAVHARNWFTRWLTQESPPTKN
ncbi:MAG: alpha/beta fold hydrolase [Planctomycetaceae bacterium]|nr:alpha/beta fold hydrolase [Planctomycetaceae bacterium]